MLIKKIMVVVLAILFIWFVHAQNNVNTGINVTSENFRPVFSGTIPNITIAMGANVTNALDLNSYFFDNETLTYSYSDVQNISVSINQSGNSSNVSFYPDFNFEGLRNITFTASDGYLSEESNRVFINVTNDSIPPWWSNPSKSRATIYQNDYVIFSTTWTDNLRLKESIFSISENNEWENYTSQTLTGTNATSYEGVQISARPGSQVYWRFYAKDSAGNTNVTNTESFVVSYPDESGESNSSNGSSNSNSKGDINIKKAQELYTFEIDPEVSSFKMETKQGNTETIILKFTNTGNQILNFNITILGLEVFEISMSESAFELLPGESKTVVIEIKVDRFMTPDIYFGSIFVRVNQRTITIPVSIIVNPSISEYNLSLQIPEDYQFIKQGKEAYANITLESLKDILATSGTIYYAIRDLSGNVIDSNQEDFSFQSQKIEFYKKLRSTDETKPGEYIFYARATIEGESILAADTLIIGQRFILGAFIKSNLVILIIILLILSSIIFYVRYMKNMKRLRLLNLYVVIQDMKSLLKEGKIDLAIQQFIRVKQIYGETISYTGSNKEELIKNMNELIKRIETLKSENPSSTQSNPQNNDTLDKSPNTNEKKAEDKDMAVLKNEPAKDNNISLPAENIKIDSGVQFNVGVAKESSSNKPNSEDLDALSVPHTKVRGFQTLRHEKISKKKETPSNFISKGVKNKNEIENKNNKKKKDK